MNAWTISSICLAVLIGCGTDNLESERDTDDILDTNAVECRKTARTGCLQGQIPVAPNIYVQGEKFFDVNELAGRFKELLPTVQNKEGMTLTAEELELTWLTKVDNDTFTDGFHVYLKGAGARDQGVISNGSFAIHRLQPGYYDVRVQKEFKFTLAAAAAAVGEGNASIPTDTADEDTAVVEDKETDDAVYCATLYSEDSVEIRQGYRTGTLVFDRFEVELNQCGQQKESKTISLN